MKNFFAFIGVLVVLFVGIGIWQNWFKFAVNSDNKVTLEVDGQKVKDDGKAAIEAGKEKLEDLKKKDDSPKPTESTPTDPKPTGTKLVDTPGPLFGGR